MFFYNWLVILQFNLVQAYLPINDNYGMWLSHHQKLSSDGQKSPWHIRLDILNRFAKGMSAKIVQRCHTEKRVFGLTINPNSNLEGFIRVLINPTLKRWFFTRLSCVIVYLFSGAQLCAFFWSTAFGRRLPEFTRLRLAIVSGSTEIKIMRSKKLFLNFWHLYGTAFVA